MTEHALAVVKDLFFGVRIRETARLVRVPIDFARSPEELERHLLDRHPDLVILDLTQPGWDYGALFAVLERSEPRPAILAFTTHALARTTQPYHGRCDRVVTKEAFTQELPDILTHGVGA
ncbi:MAG: hypothetical protein ACE5FK_06630 [Candidatus Methylomirabilia bacterium]